MHSKSYYQTGPKRPNNDGWETHDPETWEELNTEDLMDELDSDLFIEDFEEDLYDEDH